MPEVKEVKLKRQQRKGYSFLPLILRKIITDLNKYGHININEFKASITNFYEPYVQYIPACLIST